MSQPISFCMWMEAAKSDESYQRLLDIHKNNHLFGGHYTQFGCTHTPDCKERLEVTEEDIANLNERMTADWNAFMSEHDKEKCSACNPKNWGTPGVAGAK